MQPGRALRPGGSSVGPSKLRVLESSCSEDLGEIMETFLDNQRMTLNSKESHVDVVLILADGVIPVHGVLLASLSPVFRTCFESQGPYYFGIREVILPDYDLQTMQKVIQLIYNESVYCQDESETEEVKAAIKDLGIKLSSPLESVKVSDRYQVCQIQVEALLEPSEYQETKEIKKVPEPMNARKSTGCESSPVYRQFMHEENSSSEDSETDTEKAKNRCCIYFRLCKDTEMLLQHYAQVHRKGGGAEGAVVCPWCEKSITIKGLSNHIIITHSKDAGDAKSQSPERSNDRKRYVSKAPRSTRSHGVVAKKAKLGELKVGKLD